MALLVNNFLILSAILNNTIYFHIPKGVIEGFICIDEDGLKNDTWPTNWKRLYLNHTQYHGDLFEYTIPDDETLYGRNYKLRYIFFNRSYGDTSDWRSITTRNNDIVHTEHVSPPAPYTNGIKLLWFSSAGLLCLILNLVYRIIKYFILKLNKE